MCSYKQAYLVEKKILNKLIIKYFFFAFFLQFSFTFLAVKKKVEIKIKIKTNNYGVVLRTLWI